MKSAGYYDLRQALTEPGCALCRLLARNADNYIDGVLWELVNDADTRQNLKQARGYCRDHAWMLVRHGASLGIAVMLEDVLKTLLQVLDAADFTPPPTSSLNRVWQKFNQNQASEATAALVADLSPQAPCPVCAQVQVSKKYFVEALVRHFCGPGGLEPVYRTSAGFCLPHFRLVLSRVSDEATLTALVEAQKAVWQRLQAELSEFIRKNDYRYMQEGFGLEGNSWLRVIEAISGAAPPKVKGQ